MRGAPVAWVEDQALFRRWAAGQTGLPFVDACMRELAHTGWMSNRGRQNVASLLAKVPHAEAAGHAQAPAIGWQILLSGCRWNGGRALPPWLQELHLDWRLGAELFESLLLDHDWAVNACNWAYFAGARWRCGCNAGTARPEGSPARTV